MSHEITATDNLFTVRKPAWHGLGVTFPDYPTREEAQAIAHPWEPITEPVYMAEPVVPSVDNFGDDLGVEHHEIEGYRAVRRSDDGSVLGVVSDTYTLVLNDELWDIAEALESSSDDVMFETGGSLKGGRHVWLLLRLKDPLEIPGDPRGATMAYYALQNAHDGSAAFRGQATSTRIVCANTSQLADMDAKAKGTEFVFRHTRNVSDRIEQAKVALAGWRHALDDWQVHMEYLIGQKTPAGIEHAFLRKFIPMPPSELASDRVRNNIERDRAIWLEGYNSITGEGVKDSAYGLVQASVEYLEWGRRAFSNESRFTRSFLRRSDLVRRAAKIAEEAVHASEELGTAPSRILMGA